MVSVIFMPMCDRTDLAKQLRVSANPLTFSSLSVNVPTDIRFVGRRLQYATLSHDCAL